MRILFFKCLIFLLLLFSPSGIFAQKMATPLEPQAPPKQTEFGVLFGLGANNQYGIYQPKCDSCQFSDGSKLGITTGFVFMRDISQSFQWGGLLVYNSLSLYSSYLETELVPIEIDTGVYEGRFIPFRQKGEFDIAELEFQPFIQFEPVGFFFLRLGMQISILAKANFKQTKELLKFRDTLKTGEVVDLEIVDHDPGNPFQKVTEDNEIPDVKKFQIAIQPALGFNFEISPQIYFSPVFEYTVPLTQIRVTPNNFSSNKWRIWLELRFAIQVREFKETRNME